MEIFKDNGDNHLSVSDCKLWDLTYSCLLNYSCPVIFKQYGPDCSRKIDKIIMFFIPKEHPSKYLVKEYLKNELEKEESDGVEREGVYFFGCRVFIYEFNGVKWYLDRRDSEQLARETFKYFLDVIKKKKGE